MSDSGDGGPWCQRSEELARWALVRLANRTDRCGGYYVNHDEQTKPTTRPDKGPQNGFVSRALLTRHFRATATDQIVGLHSLNEQSLGKWVAIDVDAHPGRPSDPKANESLALAVFADLVALGFAPLLYESNGRGGYHLVVLFSRHVPGRVLLHLGRWLVRSHATHGLPDRPEVFPKQEAIDEETGYGSWLRVIGRHHTFPFWPRVWTGREWVDGESAVEHVLGLAGDDPKLVPFEVLAASGSGTPEEDPVGEKGRAAWELTPGDDFNQRDEWPTILEPHGWKLDHREGDKELWTRPGKRGGTSATLGFCKGDSFRKLYVFTNGAAPLQERETYSPFGAYFVLNHGGDARKAYRELADRGYGRRAPARSAPEPKGEAGPVHLVLDAADAAALARLGITCVACSPGESGVPEPIAARLRAVPPTLEVVVVGTFGAHPEIGEGATERLARAAANLLGRAVRIAAMPEGYRTVAEWIDGIKAGWSESEDWAAAAAEVREVLAANPRYARPGATGGSPSRFRFIDSDEFLAGDYRPQWLVPRLLVRGQPGVIAGPSKGMKTSKLIDLAVSMATATPFLGAFPVRERVRVAIVSGESGEHTLKETCLRVLRARGLDGSALSGWLKWEFSLPKFSDLAVMAEFGKQLVRVEADVIVVDPLYLCLGDVDAKNLFDMGSALRTIGEVLRQMRPGLTVVLVHHANRTLPTGEPMELQHLAYSGLEQFARQFILLNRREPYGNDGTHKLWLRVGGSSGQGGLWGTDIDEGIVDESFEGRHWGVTVLTPDEVRARAASSRDATKRERCREEAGTDERAVLEAVDAEVGRGVEGATMSRIRRETGFGDAKAKRIVQRLIDSDVLEEFEFAKVRGKGATRVEKGYRRAPD